MKPLLFVVAVAMLTYGVYGLAANDAALRKAASECSPLSNAK